MGIVAAASEVMRYRGLIKQLAARDLKLRYERSALGFLWSLLNPLVMIGIYTFFFSIVLRMGIERYPVFLVSVLLPWNFLTRGLLSVAPLPYQSGYLLNRAAFPAESLIFSGMLSAFADFCLEVTVFTVILAAVGAPLFPGLLVVPAVMALHFLFTAGVALFLAVAYVFYRDTQYIAGIISTAWLYLTPVFYPVSLVPERFQSLYKLNPMVHIAGSFREPLYSGSLPHLSTLAIAGTAACGVFILGWLFFNRYKREFPEIA